MRILHLLTGAAVAATLVFSGNPARAAEDATEASATGKGITGGALLGAEVIMLVEAAIKVKKPWAYAVGGIAGGIAGGVGGYFIEDGAEPKISIYLLAGGMALAIPTTVAVLNATAYQAPSVDATEDRAPADEPAAEPAQPSAAPAPQGAVKKARTRRVARRPVQQAELYTAPPALVGLSPTAVTLSVPALEVRNAFTRTEIMEFGVKQSTEVRVPVMRFVF
jgi:hypothetical protein